jgi:hypothetical protein
MRLFRTLLTAAAVSALMAGAAQAQDAKTAEALRDKALLDRTAWDVTEDLTTNIGPRLVGSPAMEKRQGLGRRQVQGAGLHQRQGRGIRQAVVDARRGERRAGRALSDEAGHRGPGPHRLDPPGGIEAEVALFKTYAELIAAPESAVKGKIVVITQPMVRAQDGAGYGVAGISRRTGPVEAAKRGAAGLLIRSISTSDSTVPHTGVTAFGDRGRRSPPPPWACRRPSNWSAWRPRARCASS